MTSLEEFMAPVEDETADIDIDDLEQLSGDVISDTKKANIGKDGMTSYDAADILELQQLKEDQYLEDGIDVPLEDIETEVNFSVDQASQNEDVRLMNRNLIDREIGDTTTAGVTNLTDLVSGEATIEEAVQAAEKAQAISQTLDMDTLYGDFDMASASIKERNTLKGAYQNLIELAAGATATESFIKTNPHFQHVYDSWVKMGRKGNFFEVLSFAAKTGDLPGIEEDFNVPFLLGEIALAPFTAIAIGAHALTTTVIKGGLTKAVKDILFKATTKQGRMVLKKGASKVTRQMVRDGSLGFISVGAAEGAKLAGAGPIMETVAGVIGPLGVIGLMHASQRGLKAIFTKMQSANADLLERIAKETKGKEDGFSKRINTAIEEVLSAPVTDISIKPRPNQSAGAAIAKSAQASGDMFAQDSVMHSVLLANSAEDNILRPIAREALDAQDVTVLSMIPGIPASTIDDPITDLGTSMYNAKTISDTAADKIFYGAVQERQKIVDGIHQLSIYKRQVDIGPSRHGWEGQSSRGLLLSQVLPQEAVFSKNVGKDIVISPTLNKHEAARLHKGFQAQLKAATKGLIRGEKKLLNHILQEGNALEQVLEVTQGGLQSRNGQHFFPCSDDVVDAYFAIRRTLDDAHKLLQPEMVRQARTRGFKMYPDDSNDLVIRDTRVKLEAPAYDKAGKPTVWTKENIEAGDQFFTVFRDGMETPEGLILKKTEVDAFLKDIPDNFNIGGYRSGYVPIRYTDKYAVTEVVKDVNGNVASAKRVHTAPTFKQAQQLVKKLDEEAANAGLDVIHIADKASRDRVEAAYSGSFAKSFHSMTKEQLEYLAHALVKSGMDKDVVDQFIKSRERFAYRKAAHLKERGIKRLKGAEPRQEVTPYGEKRIVEAAPMEPALDAIGSYLDWVGNYVGSAAYNVELEAAFKRTFRDVMSDPNDVMQPILRGTGNDALEKEARSVQEQLRVVFGLQSKYQIRADAAKEAAGQRLLRSKHPTIQRVGEFLNNGPGLWGLANFTKGVTATTKLGLMTIGQLPLQFSLVLNSVGASGGRLLFQGNRAAQLKAMTAANADFVMALAPKILTNLPFNKKGRELYSFIERSGFVADIDFAELHRLFTDVQSVRGLTGSWLRRTSKTGTYFWRKGEELSRIYALLVEKRNVEKLIKLGRHPTLKPKDIGTDKFVDEVSEGAMRLSLNMSRFNQPKITRGLMGVPMMFKNFGIQQARVFFNKKNLTRAEKAGIWMAWTGAFGLRGVPFLWDILTWGEDIATETVGPQTAMKATEEFPRWAAQQIAERLQDTKIEKISKQFGLDVGDKKFWFRYAVQGLDSALTDGQMSMGTRASISEMFNHYTSASPIADLLFGAPGQVIRKMMREVPGTVNDLRMAIEDAGEISPEMGIDAARRLTTELSGPGALFRAGEALYTGVLRDKNGFIVEEDPTLLDIMQTAMSLTPGDIQMEKQVKGHIHKAQKAWKDWSKEKAKRIAQLYVQENAEHGDRLLEKYSRQILAYNPKLYQPFVNLMFFYRVNGAVDIEKQTELLMIQNLYITQSINEGWEI